MSKIVVRSKVIMFALKFFCSDMEFGNNIIIAKVIKIYKSRYSSANIFDNQASLNSIKRKFKKFKLIGKTKVPPLIPPKTFIASSHSLALKNTQVMLIKLKVINQASSEFILKPRFLQIRWMTIATPCNAPQSTNIQLAPCQSPPMRKTLKRLK